MIFFVQGMRSLDCYLFLFVFLMPLWKICKQWVDALHWAEKNIWGFHSVKVIIIFIFGNRNVLPKTCSHITSTVLVKWLDGWEESVKPWSHWRLCQWRGLFVCGHMKHCVSSRTGENPRCSVEWFSILISPYWPPYISFHISSENLAVNQDIIILYNLYALKYTYVQKCTQVLFNTYFIMTRSLAIFILLHVWQNHVYLGKLLYVRTLCDVYYKELTSH